MISLEPCVVDLKANSRGVRYVFFIDDWAQNFVGLTIVEAEIVITVGADKIRETQVATLESVDTKQAVTWWIAGVKAGSVSFHIWLTLSDAERHPITGNVQVLP